jgi:2,3-bisphosphoglycerate-independent phosphoglycerate mutase
MLYTRGYMRPLVLVILDGWGYSNQKLGNAILSANTAYIDTIRGNFPALGLQASGKSVGLEWGEPGNSEVGHLTIGAGRTVFQYSTRINRSIESGDFFTKPAFLNAALHVQKNNSSLHLVGLLGSGTVHSNFEHIISLLDFAKRNNLTKVYLHLFTDGKDSSLKEGPDLIEKLNIQIKKLGVGIIATLTGRHYAMDRDTNWTDRTQKAYDLFTKGVGEQAPDPIAYLNASYAQDINDTKLHPAVVDPKGIIEDNDAVIFFNFREDSMRQISQAFVQPQFDKFPRKEYKNLFVALMTQYIEDPTISLNVAFPLPEVDNGLAQALSKAGKRQLHIAETEKYAHATYFFNCLRNSPYEGESDILVESHKQHLEHPEMKASEIADRFLEEFAKDIYDFTIINFANADILSHTGNLEAATKGCEHIDAALGRVYEAIMARDGILIITADHGNAESLIYKGTGEAETKHNTNPVPLYIVAREYQRPRTREESDATVEKVEGLISDVAPTILELLQIQAPAEMAGASLLRLVV